MSTPTDLTPRVVALETDDTTLQTLSGTLDTRVTALEGSNTDLTSRVTKLEADFADLQAKYDALNTRVTTLEGNATPPPPLAEYDSPNTHNDPPSKVLRIGGRCFYSDGFVCVIGCWFPITILVYHIT